MNSPATKLVRRLWHYCNVLRDDGLSYPDYVEQLTYLLFLKMADELRGNIVPAQHGWGTFMGKDALEIHRHYGKTLKFLSRQKGMLGFIFGDAVNKIRDPEKLRVLVLDLIGQSDWTGMSEDVKGDAYEGLLEKNAQDTKSGAGQYFTPRPLINAIVACIQPRAGEVVCDPACGTGGFLLAAHEYMRNQVGGVNRGHRRHLQNKAIRGVELVREVARLATMNLLLHGIGDAKSERVFPIECADSLAAKPRWRADVILTNPPFGVKGSFVSNGESGGTASNGAIIRSDFWARTANKQLNFLQHVYSMLKQGGRAAVVVPDNVLYEGGAAEEIRRQLLTRCYLHTVLRLPAGIFYAHGVKANVLFFDRLERGKAVAPHDKLWVFDLRTGTKFSLKSNPIAKEHLVEFLECYKPGSIYSRVEQIRETKDGIRRWRSYEMASVLARPSCNLDITWGADALISNVPPADRLRMLSTRVASDLRQALRLVEEAGAGLSNSQDG